jgi:hypothetical protein
MAAMNASAPVGFPTHAPFGTVDQASFLIEQVRLLWKPGGPGVPGSCGERHPPAARSADGIASEAMKKRVSRVIADLLRVFLAA